MQRRTFLQLGAGALGSALAGWRPAARAADTELQAATFVPPAFSVIPVVGDGKWIWTKPPDGQTGYLEPRTFTLEVGIELTGRGNATPLAATTTVPVACPEQKIDEEHVVANGCQAQIRQLAPYSRQLCLSAPQIVDGQTISAVAQLRLTISKQYFNYRRAQFPEAQTVPNEVRRQYLGDSPGIETRCKEIKKLLDELRGKLTHPWDLAQQFAAWIPRHIQPQIGTYTGVIRALDAHRGDCEEMSAVFVALCRAAGIPARLVWVPNHNWAEFYLTDSEGQEHWIPAHTACYFWFGWTGAHELVLQKGDRIRVPERGRNFRLTEDWMQWGGRRPEVRYLAKLTPQPAASGEDPGPGAREKIATGEWKLLGTNPLDRYARR